MALALLAACGDDPATGSDTSSGTTTDATTTDAATTADLPLSEYPEDGLFTDIVNFIVVEIAYADGAAPYVGSVGLGGDLWDIFKGNVAALFAKHPRSLQVPTTLAEMQAIGDAGQGPFTTDAILALAAAHRQVEGDHGRRVFFVLFLDGQWEKDGQAQPQVLAINIGDTGVIAMFKPVIAGNGVSKERVEQTTLVHEFGHAVGLVNVGLPPQGDHHDEAHGGHCENPECIMFWRNEVGADLSQYVVENLLGSDTVLFDQDCLDDAEAAAGP